MSEVIHLKPKEFDLLVFLARNHGIVLSRDLILERVWGWDYDGGSRTVDVHVRWLREKIEEDPANPHADLSPCAASAIGLSGSMLLTRLVDR